MSKLVAYLYSQTRPNEEQLKRFEKFLRGKYGAGTTLEWVESGLYPGGFPKRGGSVHHSHAGLSGPGLRGENQCAFHPGGELEVEAAARRGDRGADGPVQEDGPGVWPGINPSY